MSEATKQPESWAIVELMGHVKLAGRLTEEERFGVKMGRLDVPTENVCANCNGSSPLGCIPCAGRGKLPAFVTQLFGGQSVYRITYVTEEVARHIAKGTQAAPVSPWDFPKQLPEPAATSASIHDDTFDDEPDSGHMGYGDIDRDDMPY